jgi:hypothetical protein
MASKPTQTSVDSYLLTGLLRELPPAEFVLYLALYELTAGSRLRTVALGIGGLSDLTGLSKSSIQRVVKGLKKRRLISVSLLKPTSTPEYAVCFPWRKASSIQEKPSIVKKHIVKRPPRKPTISSHPPGRRRREASEKSEKPSTFILNIDEKELLPPSQARFEISELFKRFLEENRLGKKRSRLWREDFLGRFLGHESRTPEQALAKQPTYLRFLKVRTGEFPKVENFTAESIQEYRVFLEDHFASSVPDSAHHPAGVPTQAERRRFMEGLWARQRDILSRFFKWCQRQGLVEKGQAWE